MLAAGFKEETVRSVVVSCNRKPLKMRHMHYRDTTNMGRGTEPSGHQPYLRSVHAGIAVHNGGLCTVTICVLSGPWPSNAATVAYGGCSAT